MGQLRLLLVVDGYMQPVSPLVVRVTQPEALLQPTLHYYVKLEANSGCGTSDNKEDL